MMCTYIGSFGLMILVRDTMSFLNVVLLSLAIFSAVNGQEYNCRRMEDCMNGATCESAGTCTCTAGFNTYNCQYDATTPCTDLVCENGGTCVTDNGVSVCACAHGYYGDTCQNSMVQITCLGPSATYTLSFPPSFEGNVDLKTPLTDPGCSVASATDADGRKTYSITYDLDAAATGNCPLDKIAQESFGDTTLYSAFLTVNYVQNIMTSLDELYNLTCAHVAGVFDVYQDVQDVQVTDDNLSGVNKDKTFSPVELTLLDSSDAVLDPTQPIFVGDNFKVSVYLTDSDVFTTIRLESCEANNTLLGTDEKIYSFFEQGCPTALGLRIAEEQVQGTITVTGTGYTAATVSLKAFKFVDSQKLGIKCSAKMCKAGDASCEVPTNCADVRTAAAAPTVAPTVAPAEGRRRRRAADEDSEQKEVTAQLTVLNPGETLQQPQTDLERETTVENCLQETAILTMIVVMVAVVFILLIAAFVLGCLLVRKRKPKSTFESMGSLDRSDRFHIPRARVNESFSPEI